MSKEELEKFIELLDKDTNKEDIFFSIVKYNRSANDNFIKANKEGLLAFVAELMKTAATADELDDNNPNKVIEFGKNLTTNIGDTGIDYIELIRHAPKKEQEVLKPKSIKDIFVPVGCVMFVIIIIIALFAGFWTIGKWLF